MAKQQHGARVQRQPELRGFGEMRNRLGVRLAFAATAFLDRYSELLHPLSLTPSRVLALAFLREHRGCEQKLLADGLAITEASAMSKINRLEALGLVERRPGINRRSKSIILTAKGEEAYERALALDSELTTRLLGWIDTDTRAQLEALFDGVLERALDQSRAC